MTDCSLTLIVVCPLAVRLRKGHFPTYYTLEQDTRFELALSVLVFAISLALISLQYIQ